MNTMTRQSSALAVETSGNHIAPQRQPGMGIMNPSTMAEAMEMAKMLADSSIVPADFKGKPGNVLVAVQWGAEIGLAPLQAMQSIAVINGRPSIWGDAMLGLVQGSGALEYIREDITEDGSVATCTLKRRSSPVEIVRQFTMDEAKKAGLANKTGPWQQYPRRMLQLRARAFALRDGFADVLRGVHIAEEARDTPVMRDVTPGADPAQTTTTEKVRAKVSAKKADAPSLKDVLARIEAAANEDDLNVVGAECGKLNGSEKDDARAAYRARLNALREAAAPAAPETPDFGIFVSHVESMLRSELDAGADLAGVLETYSEQVSQIRATDSAALDAMLDRIREDFPA